MTRHEPAMIDDIRRLARGEPGAKRELLWNPRGTWPGDYHDPQQAPHGRPIPYWVPTVAGQTVGWEGQSGWGTRREALRTARRFRAQCRATLTEWGMSWT